MAEPESEPLHSSTLGPRKGEGSPALLREAFSELQAHHEELRVAEEELRVQNDELAAAALALDTERRRYRDLFHAAPDPSLLTDTQGIIREANPAAYALLGVGPRSLVGKPLAVFIAPASRRVFRTELLGHAEVRERWIYFQPRGGPLLYATVHLSPAPDANGQTVGLRWLIRGATPDPGAELERYRRLVGEVRDFAIFTLDAENRILTWNAGAEAIFGYTASEAVGQSGAIIFTPEDRAEGAPEQEQSQAAATGRAEDERWHIRKDGSRLWASGVLTALRDGGGGPPWYAKIVRDLTERRLHEQHEHAVVVQLQAAVQPAAPLALPGLAVRSFYRPAAGDASIGGDFFDAFGLGDGRSALAVGDVSGKGLDAASQVATVRNMLRFALYNPPRPDEGPARAIEALNRTLAGHGLLSGFVTLFVGVFDPKTTTLTYVNCGQEPAVVRRADTGRVEALRYTGPILGLDAASKFTEEQVTLSVQDALAVFTDGLTDMGPSRTEMLGEEGVLELLQGAIGEEAGAQGTAERVASRLTGVVDAQGPANVPDDVCVLVAVVETDAAGG